MLHYRLLCIVICAGLLAGRCVFVADAGLDDETTPLVTGLLAAVAASPVTATTTTESPADTSGGTTILTPDDRGDGTVAVAALGQTWAKCAQSDAVGGNVYAGGGTADPCAAVAPLLMYCNSADDSCNGGSITGLLDGDGTSEAYATCAALSLGGFTDWRVPTYEELGTLLFSLYLPNTSVFPNTTGGLSNQYWSSGSFGSIDAYTVDFAVLAALNQLKTNGYLVRCIRDGV